MKDLIERAARSHPKLERGQVWCTTCGHTQQVNATAAMHFGWPKHCGYTMTIDSPAERAARNSRSVSEGKS